jgi:HNH endonuclease
MKKRIHCRPGWTLQQRLAHYTRIDPISGCHLWQGAVNDGGYGTLGVRGRTRRAHRLAWSLRHGPIPARMDICHRCDERRCINPDHLFLESHAANMADRGRKDRARRKLAHADRRRDDVAIVRLYYRDVHMKGELSVEPFDPDAVLGKSERPSQRYRRQRCRGQPIRRRYSAMRRSQ